MTVIRCRDLIRCRFPTAADPVVKGAYCNVVFTTPVSICQPYLIPIPGTTKKERVKENFEAVNVELSPEEMWEIEEVLSHMDIVGMGRG